METKLARTFCYEYDLLQKKRQLIIIICIIILSYQCTRYPDVTIKHLLQNFQPSYKKFSIPMWAMTSKMLYKILYKIASHHFYILVCSEGKTMYQGQRVAVVK